MQPHPECADPNAEIRSYLVMWTIGPGQAEDVSVLGGQLLQDGLGGQPVSLRVPGRVIVRSPCVGLV
jgi:hypothetical protein